MDTQEKDCVGKPTDTPVIIGGFFAGVLAMAALIKWGLLKCKCF